MTVADNDKQSIDVNTSKEPLVASPGSAREYVGGDKSHVTLSEARHLAVEKVAEAEAALEVAQAAQTETWKALAAARKAHDDAYEARQRARHALRRAQDDLIRRCSLPPEKGN